MGSAVGIPQSDDWGVEGPVDGYEAVVELAGERPVAPGFVVRSMASGAAYHRALSARHATSVSGGASARVALFWWRVSAAAL